MTPPPIIIHDDMETSLKFCGGVEWKYSKSGLRPKCIHYIAQKGSWNDQKDFCLNQMGGRVTNLRKEVSDS